MTRKGVLKRERWPTEGKGENRPRGSRLDETKVKAKNSGVNQYALYVEEAGGMLAIHNLQHHKNLEMYKKCFLSMDTYFPEDDGKETGLGDAQVDESGAFALNTGVQAPQGGFQFGAMQ